MKGATRRRDPRDGHHAHVASPPARHLSDASAPVGREEPTPQRFGTLALGWTYDRFRDAGDALARWNGTFRARCAVGRSLQNFGKLPFAIFRARDQVRAEATGARDRAAMGAACGASVAAVSPTLHDARQGAGPGEKFSFPAQAKTQASPTARLGFYNGELAEKMPLSQQHAPDDVRLLSSPRRLVSRSASTTAANSPQILRRPGHRRPRALASWNFFFEVRRTRSIRWISCIVNRSMKLGFATYEYVSDPSRWRQAVGDARQAYLKRLELIDLRKARMPTF